MMPGEKSRFKHFLFLNKLDCQEAQSLRVAFQNKNYTRKELNCDICFSVVRLSVMQLATSTDVYLLDIISLEEALNDHDWKNWALKLFANAEVLKLGLHPRFSVFYYGFLYFI